MRKRIPLTLVVGNSDQLQQECEVRMLPDGETPPEDAMYFAASVACNLPRPYMACRFLRSDGSSGPLHDDTKVFECYEDASAASVAHFGDDMDPSFGTVAVAVPRA